MVVVEHEAAFPRICARFQALEPNAPQSPNKLSLRPDQGYSVESAVYTLNMAIDHSVLRTLSDAQIILRKLPPFVFHARLGTMTREAG